MSNDSNTTQRDELAREIFITDNARNEDPAALWDEADHERMHYAEVIADGLIAKYILIPRTELPKVTLSDHGNGLCTALAQENFQPLLRREARDEGPAFNWRIALANLAVAEAIEMRDKAQAETKLQERRDALTQEFSTYPYRYDNVSPTACKAIDRIIELEDAAEATR